MDASVTATGNTISATANFISSTEVECVVATNDVKTTLVQISNNGASTTAKKGLFIPFDATCYTCVVRDGGAAACTPRVRVRLYENKNESETLIYLPDNLIKIPIKGLFTSSESGSENEKD